MKTIETQRNFNLNNQRFNNQYSIGRGGLLNLLFKIGLLFNIQVGKITKSPMLLFGVFGIPTLLFLGIGAMVPDSLSLCATFGMATIPIAAVIFGDLYYTIEKSTMEKSTGIANYGHKTKLFSISLVTFATVMIAMTFLTLMFVTFESLNFYIMDYFVFLGEYDYNSSDIIWKNIQWLNFIYYIGVNTLLTIALFIFVKNFFKSNKTFIMFALSYTLLDIMFGGVLINTYNQVIVEINEQGQIVSTGQAANISVARGETDVAVTWNSWYSYVKFLIPHFFINQQFSTLFKVGQVQLQGAYHFDANGIYHFNWDAVSVANEQTIEGFRWMLLAQNTIFGTEYTSMTDLMNNEEFAIAWNTLVTEAYNTGDMSLLDGAYDAFYTYNRSLPMDISFWKPYNGDYLMVMCIMLPIVYIIVLTSIGFFFTRINK